MKRSFSTLIFALFLACSSKETDTSKSDNILEALAYSVDTVVVDPGDDFFNLGHGLGRNVLSQDKNRLLYFERNPLALVQVDLNNLKLISKNEFQREGPNGVGDYISDFEVGPNGNLYVKSYNVMGKFTPEGELTENLKIVPEGIDPELAKDYRKLFSRTIFDFQENRIYSQPNVEGSEENLLVITDLETKKSRSLPIPKMKIVQDFSGTFTTETKEGRTMISFFSVASYMGLENAQLLISAAPMSGFYRFDPASDSLKFVDIQHKTVPNQMTITVNTPPTNEVSFMEDRRKIEEEFHYMILLWDETREMYLRLGKKSTLGENSEDPPTHEVYLFAYDKEFNVLGETKLEGLDQVPHYHFWKDGKLWSYVNVEDELGFAVFTFDF